ncbi:Senescence regulator S40 [Spatholobus suberectus]|nr:Senescence regulator S40 [Spatholobus suberectus]
MADRGVFLNKSWGVGEGAMEDKDFDEEDVWGVANERDDSGQKTTGACKESCGSSSAWRLPAAPRKIPRANALPASDAPLVKGSSAPMDIPDWSKIYGKSCKKGSRDDGVRNKVDDDEDEDMMVPPHEWIARKLARSQISSFSVCEGMGRTLKGRDLSKVRNAILTKTGFIE